MTTWELMKMRLKNKKGQGMTEYIVILAIIVALVMFFKDKFKQPMETKVTNLTNQIAQ